MGKIRIKTFGDEEQEAEQEKKKQAKKEAKIAEKSAKAQSASGGKAEKAAVEPVIASETKSREAGSGSARQSNDSGQAPLQRDPDMIGARMTNEEIAASPMAPRKDKKQKKEKFQKAKGPKHSKKYLSVAMALDKTKIYPLSEAVSLLPQLKTAKFDETVELHVNILEGSLSTSVTLPHGTGKQTRVAIADDKLIADIEKGQITFDVLLAAPQMMPKLAKVAKILGPKGLMPNPKSGTVTQNPEEAAKKYAGGHMQLKTESKFPILHVAVGKISFGEKKLQENIKVVFAALPVTKIKNATLKLTMSPGIKVAVN